MMKRVKDNMFTDFSQLPAVLDYTTLKKSVPLSQSKIYDILHKNGFKFNGRWLIKKSTILEMLGANKD